MGKTRRIILTAAAVLAFFSGALPASGETAIRPFVLAFSGPAGMDAKLAEVKAGLAREGFQIVGEYEPYEDTRVVVVTSDELLELAGMSEHGGFGAVQRVSLVKKGENVQVAYTNPPYMAYAYRMKGDAAAAAEKLKAALGGEKEFGSRKGLTEKKLRSYHYMAFMPYFKDQRSLGEFESHGKAVSSVEEGLRRGEGAALVYKVDIPGKDEVLFGAAVLSGDGADGKVMSVVDKGETSHAPHLPYEILVSGSGAYMLHGKFRIAINFPDLTMGTFMKISGAPGGIEKTLKKAIGK